MRARAAGRLGCHVTLTQNNFVMLLLRRAAMVSFATLALIVFTAAPAHAWGCKGHQIVALIAEKHLTAHAEAMIKKILADGPIDPNLSRYCKEGGIDAMADASTWADDIRAIRPEVSPWHYVDIPLGTKGREVEKFCDPKEGCVTSAIRDDLAILRSANPDPQKRADALRFLIHFVGDLHQPLHAVSNNDLGGNCVPVSFFDEVPQLRNQQLGIYSPNLHAVWDTNILEKAAEGKSVDQLATELDQAFRPKIVGWLKSPADIDGWVWESYALAGKIAYAKLPAQIPVEKPAPVKSCSDDNHVAERMLKLNERLNDRYQQLAAPIVRERLAQAGARLALILNQLRP